MIGLAASYALDIVVLALAAWATPLRSVRLFLALFALSWLIGSFSLLIEAAAFAVVTPAQAVAGALSGAVQFALMAALVTAGAGLVKSNEADVRPARFTLLRLALVIVAYVALYIAAGMLVLPFVRQFYEGRAMPGFGLVVSLQVVRALIFAAGAALLLRGGLRRAPWVLGVAFSVVAGIAPLLPDNPYMPLAMRLAHMAEVGVSNFIFGVVTALLLRGRRT